MCRTRDIGSSESTILVGLRDTKEVPQAEHDVTPNCRFSWKGSTIRSALGHRVDQAMVFLIDLHLTKLGMHTNSHVNLPK